MAGFKADGSVGFGGGASGSDSVVFCLKSEAGKEIKTYIVPSKDADSFVKKLQAERDDLMVASGESSPLHLVKVEKCF
jgi:hypothetical protein